MHVGVACFILILAEFAGRRGDDPKMLASSVLPEPSEVYVLPYETAWSAVNFRSDQILHIGPRPCVMILKHQKQAPLRQPII